MIHQMEERILAYFSKFRPLTTAEKAAIRQDLKIETKPKGTVLLRIGQIPHDNFFVLKGCIRQFYLKDGEEKTTHFYTEEEWIFPAIGVQQGGTSNFALECTEDTWVMVGNENRGNELMQRFPKFQELSIRILENEIVKQQQKIAKYNNSTPEERYRTLQHENPQLINRIPQYQLSSYIGVKPESLSRIRRRMADKWNS